MANSKEDLKEEEYNKTAWVMIGISRVNLKPDGKPDYHNPELLHRYDLPRWLHEKRMWVIRWRLAWLQCQYPRHTIQLSHAYYDKKLNRKTGLGTPLSRYRGAKGMVTKLENALKEFEAHYVPTFFAPIVYDDEKYKKAIAKLERYRRQVKDYEIEVQNDEPVKHD